MPALRRLQWSVEIAAPASKVYQMLVGTTAKAAGVYVFGGGIDESVPPALVSADGTVAEGGYPWALRLDRGFTVLELPSREEAVAWAARIAKDCRCDQELRVFGFDPHS